MWLTNLILALPDALTTLSPIQFETVYPWQQGVHYRLGRDRRLLHQGLHWRFALIDTILVRTTAHETVNLDPQTVTTADDVSVTLRGAMAIEIFDLRTLYNSVENWQDDLEVSAMGMICARTADLRWDLVRFDKEVCRGVTQRLRRKFQAWGVNLLKFYLTDCCETRSYRHYGEALVVEDED